MIGACCQCPLVDVSSVSDWPELQPLFVFGTEPQRWRHCSWCTLRGESVDQAKLVGPHNMTRHKAGSLGMLLAQLRALVQHPDTTASDKADLWHSLAQLLPQFASPKGGMLKKATGSAKGTPQSNKLMRFYVSICLATTASLCIEVSCK